MEQQWQDVGSAAELGRIAVQEVRVGKATIALSCRDGIFGAVSGTCLHVGGPLGQGTLEGDHLVCPWHSWRFHRVTGEAAFADNRVARHDVRVENGRVLVAVEPATKPGRAKRDPDPLARARGARRQATRALGSAPRRLASALGAPKNAVAAASASMQRAAAIVRLLPSVRQGSPDAGSSRW